MPKQFNPFFADQENVGQNEPERGRRSKKADSRSGQGKRSRQGKVEQTLANNSTEYCYSSKTR